MYDFFPTAFTKTENFTKKNIAPLHYQNGDTMLSEGDARIFRFFYDFFRTKLSGFTRFFFCHELHELHIVEIKLGDISYFIFHISSNP
jgi:hypothetical protein